MTVTYIFAIVFVATIIGKLINEFLAKRFQKLMAKIDPIETKQLQEKGLALYPKHYHLIHNTITILMYVSLVGGIVSFFV